MSARDKFIALTAGFWREHTNTWMCTGEDIETFADLIRADAMEAATRAANESWTLMCKKMVGLEREACAKVCENEAKEHDRNTYDARDGRYDWQADGANACAAAIRARENT